MSFVLRSTKSASEFVKSINCSNNNNRLRTIKKIITVVTVVIFYSKGFGLHEIYLEKSCFLLYCTMFPTDLSKLPGFKKESFSPEAGFLFEFYSSLYR